jgi:hypothetical protein
MTQDQIISGGLGIVMFAIGGALILGSYDNKYPFNLMQSVTVRRALAGLSGVIFICQGIDLLRRSF